MGEALVYEVSSLFVPELDSETLSQIIDSIKTKITDLEGSIISEGEPVYIKLAYEVQKSINNKIKKVNFAHFAWTKFFLSPTNVAEFEKFLNLTLGEKIMRYLIIKTVEENTVLTKLTEAKNTKADEDLIEEVVATDVTADAEVSDAVTDLGDDSVIPVEAAVVEEKEE